MATTYYQTLNGRIRGETTSGVRTNYLTDALGTVTATVNASSVVVNTFRYKPYGTQLAKTGAGSDPLFLWTGDLGSRSTGRSYSENYNRARHYGNNISTWSTRDILWPMVGAYTYASSDPIGRSDPSGYLDVTYKKCWNWVFRCGGADYAIEFTMPKNANGWIIQKVRAKYNYKDCWGRLMACRSCTGVGPGGEETYYEAWKVSGGKIIPPMGLHCDDQFLEPGCGACTTGGVRIDGFFKFFTSTEADPILWGWRQNRPCWGHLWGSFDPPPNGWSDTGSKHHWLETDYKCCCDPKNDDSCKSCLPAGYTLTTGMTDLGASVFQKSTKC